MSRVYEEDFFVKANVERVWQALTTPAEMEAWLGMKVLSFEPRQGGKIQFEGLSTGELVAYEPPRRPGTAPLDSGSAASSRGSTMGASASCSSAWISKDAGSGGGVRLLQEELTKATTIEPPLRNQPLRNHIENHTH